MTNEAVDQALKGAIALERAARRHWQTAETHAEREAALDVVRHVTIVIRSLEKWTTLRHQDVRMST